MNSLQKVQVEKMRTSGIGFKEISEKTNIPVSTIKSYCYKHSIQDITAESDEKPLWFFLERYNDAYIAEAQSFVDACLNDRETLVGVNDGLQPVLIGLAAKESCARGGVPVRIDKEGRHD